MPAQIKRLIICRLLYAVFLATLNHGIQLLRGTIARKLLFIHSRKCPKLRVLGHRASNFPLQKCSSSYLHFISYARPIG